MLGDAGPDLTLILDLPVEVGLARAGHRGRAEARFEAKGEAFHAAPARQAFLAIARGRARPLRRRDAAGSPEAVAEAIWRAVEGTGWRPDR